MTNKNIRIIKKKYEKAILFHKWPNMKETLELPQTLV